MSFNDIFKGEMVAVNEILKPSSTPAWIDYSGTKISSTGFTATST